MPYYAVVTFAGYSMLYCAVITFTGLIPIHTIIAFNQTHRLTQPGHPSTGRCNEYSRKLWRKEAVTA